MLRHAPLVIQRPFSSAPRMAVVLHFTKRGVHMKRRGFVFIIAFLLASCAAATSQKHATVPIDDSPQQGPASAPITVVEFIDYT
jgi:hypothetical protein